MVIDVKCIIMLFTTADQMLQMCIMRCSILFVWLLFTPQVMFQQYHQVKVYTHATINGYSLTLADCMMFQL